MLHEQEKIERYLNGEMKDTEKNIFEQEIKNNKTLANNIALAKDLATFFKIRNIGITHTLSKVGNEYFSDEKPKNSTPQVPTDSPSFNNTKFIIPSLLLLVIIISGFWYFNNNNTDDKPADMYAPEMSATEAEKIINKGMTDEQGDDVINKVNEEIQTKKEESEAIEAIDLKKNLPKKENKPMATLDEASFKENLALESLIHENTRSDSQTSITAPSQAQTFQQKNGTVTLGFKGTTKEDESFEVVIYDNKTINFNNNYSLLNAELKKIPDATNEEFKLSFNVKIELKQGLYYYVIRKKENTEIIHISKFYVK